MRTGLLYLLILFFPALAISEQGTPETQLNETSVLQQVKTEQLKLDKETPADYCYKPEKPLLFAKKYHKKHYEEDLLEYQRCVRSFREFHKNLATMHLESTKNAQAIMNKYKKQ